MYFFPASRQIENVSSQRRGSDPRQIEYVSSRRCDSDILVTWNKVSESNILYNIEIFCDDVKLEEIHWTIVPQYRMKSPALGKKYHFQVWTQDKFGNSGAKVQSKNVIKVENINVEGDTINLNECKVTFPSGTFNKQTKVWISVGLDDSLVPVGYVSITPVFDISADSPFLKDAVVRIKSWCVDLDKDKVEILHFMSESEWNVINPDRILQDGSIEFRCRDFSPILAAIKKLLFGKQKLLVDNCLYHMNNNEFHFTFYSQSETVGTISRSHYREAGAKLTSMWFDPLVVTKSDTVCIKMHIEPGQENLHFDQPGGYSFSIDKKFLSNHRHKFVFCLLPDLPQYPTTRIQCELEKNEVQDQKQQLSFPLMQCGGDQNAAAIIVQGQTTIEQKGTIKVTSVKSTYEGQK